MNAAQQQKKRKRSNTDKDEVEAAEQGKPAGKEAKGDAFKQKTLMLSSRGVTHRMRHVMNDLSLLLPNIKKGASPTEHLVSIEKKNGTADYVDNVGFCDD